MNGPTPPSSGAVIQSPLYGATWAIRDYPLQYLRRWKLADGTPVIVRTARVTDEALLRDFQKSLSRITVRLRYFGSVNLKTRIRDDFSTRTFLSSYTLVVERLSPVGDRRQIIGVVYLIKADDGKEAEFAIVISDKWQRRGIGTKLLGVALGIARTEGLDVIFGYILPENDVMQRVCQKLGFDLEFNSSLGLLEARNELGKGIVFRRSR
jgi:acetyltransferase